jgi:hypothetical protein
MRALIVFVALCAPVFAQEHKHEPAKVLRDHNRGKNVIVAPQPGETQDHAMGHAVQAGDGAPTSALYGAWLVAPVTGKYVLPQFSTKKDKDGNLLPVLLAQKSHGPVQLVAGRAYLLWPWKGPLIWIRPDNVQERVPAVYLISIPPELIAKPK